ncbi:MAG: aconitase X, partial [Parvibaculaceae bacterium]
MSLVLDDDDRASLDGAAGPAMQLAMRLVLRAAEIMHAPSLIPVSFAHIDACFYAGQAHVDFARYLLDNSAKLKVPAWTNNGVVSLANPDLRDEAVDAEAVRGARELMHLYEALGCKPVWTCAPYQLPGGPKRGDHIVAGESNAVSYYNAVVGARTNKYGDYLDVACALIGKAPFAGLHTDAGRRGELFFSTASIPERWKTENIFFHLLGHHAGRIAGQRIPIIGGLPATTNLDALKALAAAMASSGGVEMWHAVGVTPEAPAHGDAFAGETHSVTPGDLRRARDELTTARDGRLDMVALGTPHFSLSECEALAALLDGRRVKPGLPVYVSTSRFVLAEARKRGWADAIETSGAEIITDTCT